LYSYFGILITDIQNDGPEAHYMGNLWPEQNTDVQPNNYANQDDWPHQAWQGIYTSFITAWKAGGNIASMKPVISSNIVEGSMWYKTILQSASCPGEGLSGGYYNKPDNYDTGYDQLNYAIVLRDGFSGFYVQCTSGGVNIGTLRPLIPGLNYGFCQGVNVGTQRIAVVTSTGTVISAANGIACVSSGCPQGMYNMNYQVVALAADNHGTCVDYAQGGFVGGVFTQKDYDSGGNWRQVTCDTGSLVHIWNSGAQQWLDAQAELAWKSAIYSWKNLAPAGVNFITYLGDFFKTRPSLQCDQIDVANCDTTFHCGQLSESGGDVNSPAGLVSQIICLQYTHTNLQQLPHHERAGWHSYWL
jgi:hypothetical protein